MKRWIVPTLLWALVFYVIGYIVLPRAHSIFILLSRHLLWCSMTLVWSNKMYQ